MKTRNTLVWFLLSAILLVTASCGTEEKKDYVLLDLQSNSTMWGTTSGGGQYIKGATAYIMAIPRPGCQFECWSDQSTANPRRITVNEDMQLMAYFYGEPSDTHFYVEFDGQEVLFDNFKAEYYPQYSGALLFEAWVGPNEAEAELPLLIFSYLPTLEEHYLEFYENTIYEDSTGMMMPDWPEYEIEQLSVYNIGTDDDPVYNIEASAIMYSQEDVNNGSTPENARHKTLRLRVENVYFTRAEEKQLLTLANQIKLKKH